jgi:hypothetical protein
MTLTDILERTGLKMEDLNAAERETALKWADALSRKDLTVADIRAFLLDLRTAVERELVEPDLSPAKDAHLKAQLKNLITLEAFLSGPERAAKALEKYLDNQRGRV